MFRRMFFALGAVFAMAGTSQSSILISGFANQVATPGLPGYSTYTITALSTDPNQQIVGFDFASQGAYGFKGPMSQINPFGLPTVFNDNNAIITGTGGLVAQDSQFLFSSASVTVPAGFASESPTSLRAVFAASAPLGLIVPFAQIVELSTDTIHAVGTVTVQNSGVFSDVPVTFDINSGPEPTTLCLVGLGVAVALGFARRR